MISNVERVNLQINKRWISVSKIFLVALMIIIRLDSNWTTKFNKTNDKKTVRSYKLFNVIKVSTSVDFIYSWTFQKRKFFKLILSCFIPLQNSREGLLNPSWKSLVPILFCTGLLRVLQSRGYFIIWMFA